MTIDGCRTDVVYVCMDYGTHSLTVSSPVEECSAFSAAEVIHTVSIFNPPGTHCYWMDRGVLDSKLAQGFYT